MAGTGFLYGRYAVEKDGRAYVLSHENALCEQIEFFSAGTYTIPLTSDTVSVTVGLVGAGGAAGKGHFHKPDIFSTIDFMIIVNHRLSSKKGILCI